MKTIRYNTFCIGLPTDKKGWTRMNQDEPGWTKTKSSTRFGSNQNQDNPNPEQPRSSRQPLKIKTLEKIAKWGL